MNATNSIPETANDNDENLMYLFEHLRHWEIPSLSLRLLPPQRLLYWLKFQGSAVGYWALEATLQ